MTSHFFNWIKAAQFLNIPKNEWGEFWPQSFNAFDLAKLQEPDDLKEQELVKELINTKLDGVTITRKPNSGDEGRILKTVNHPEGTEISNTMTWAHKLYTNTPELNGDDIIENVYCINEFSWLLNSINKEPSKLIKSWFSTIEADKPIINSDGLTRLTDKWLDYLDRNLWSETFGICSMYGYTVEQFKTQCQHGLFDDVCRKIQDKLEVIKTDRISLGEHSLHRFCEGEYFYKPIDFIHWAIHRNLPVPDELIGYLKSHQATKDDVRLAMSILDSQPEPLGNDDLHAYLKPNISTATNERELKQGLREIWIKEGRPEMKDFFPTKLKKYVNQTGSPITNIFTAGKDAGFEFRLSTGTSGKRKKKTLSNYVSEFKNTP